jgi:hypothetical protein
MSRLNRDPREPTTCRSCHARILWAVWADSGRRVPIDVTPVAQGNVVLALRKNAVLVAEKFKPWEHTGRNRFVTHFSTCPDAKTFRAAGRGKPRRP